MSIVRLQQQNRLAMINAGNRYHIAPGHQPLPHPLGIKNLTLFHHSQNEGLGHPVTTTLGAAPLFPAAAAFDGLSLSGAD
ncbi:hypothetical protein [Pseudomonas sp. TWI628]|uniref:hypothetical protein n=1 Tax=Pseudomonas sp. TWI628 TaxID=3136788 RepID=UPI00320A1A00